MAVDFVFKSLHSLELGPVRQERLQVSVSNACCKGAPSYQTWMRRFANHSRSSRTLLLTETYHVTIVMVGTNQR